MARRQRKVQAAPHRGALMTHPCANVPETERCARALRMVAIGYTPTEIASAMQCSRAWVQDVVVTACFVVAMRDRGRLTAATEIR
jgi:hypothetical protein